MKKSETFQETLFSAATVQKRLEKSTRLLNDLKNHNNRIIIYSDERAFMVDSVFNKHNDRTITLENDVSECKQTNIQLQ